MTGRPRRMDEPEALPTPPMIRIDVRTGLPGKLHSDVDRRSPWILELHGIVLVPMVDGGVACPGDQACQHIGVLCDDLHLFQPDHIGGTGGSAAAVPDVARELMMVAAAAIEGCTGIIHGHVKPEDIAIEAVRRIRVPDLEMDVPDACLLYTSDAADE